jgi:uncharacterized membrane protein
MDKKYSLPRLLLGYFLRGVLVVVPTAVTIYFVYLVINSLNNILPTKIPGLGLVIILATVTVVGYISSNFLFKQFEDFIESAISRTPLTKLIYSSIKDLVSTFVDKKKAFSHPVLVIMDKANGVRKIGFVTKNDLSRVGIEGSVAVYFPFSFAFTGELYIVPGDSVSKIDDWHSADAMKFIVSGGVTELKEEHTKHHH